MTKAQFEAILEHATAKYGETIRLRLQLNDKSYVQGTAELLGPKTLVVVQDSNSQLAYVDLDAVVCITVG